MVDRVCMQRNAEIVASTDYIIAKALYIDPLFKGGCSEEMSFWVYSFSKRWKLSCRLGTRADQKLSPHHHSMTKDFWSNLMLKFEISYFFLKEEPYRFVNMDETAECFETMRKSIVHAKGARAVPIRWSGSNNLRLTTCVFVPNNED